MRPATPKRWGAAFGAFVVVVVAAMILLPGASANNPVTGAAFTTTNSNADGTGHRFLIPPKSLQLYHDIDWYRPAPGQAARILFWITNRPGGGPYLINPDGTGFEYYARGVRNSVGFDWHPETKELYFSMHARDWLGEDVPMVGDGDASGVTGAVTGPPPPVLEVSASFGGLNGCRLPR